MSELALASAIVGTVFLILGIPLVASPTSAREWLGRFPRDSVWACALTAIALAWVTWLFVCGGPWEFRPAVSWLMSHFSPLVAVLQPLLRVEDFRGLLWVLVPLSYVLIIFFMDELLAPRALGGLLLLAASPVLDAARFHTSNLRLIMTVMAYVWVIAGIVLVVSPYRFRRTLAPWIAAESRCRSLGWAVFGLGVLVVVLALTVYWKP